jgi:hypothetical protein
MQIFIWRYAPDKMADLPIANANFYLAPCADKMADLPIANANFYLVLCADKMADLQIANANFIAKQINGYFIALRNAIKIVTYVTESLQNISNSINGHL